MSETLYDNIFHLSILSSIFAFVFSFFTGKGQSFIVPIRFYLFLAFTCDITLLILSGNGMYNLFVLPIYMIGASIIVLIWMYGSQFNSVRTKLILTLIAIVLIFIQLLTIYMKGLTAAVDIPYALMCIACTIICIYYYFVTAYNSPKRRIREIPFFWINTGFLLYFGLTIIINLVVGYIPKVDLETYLLLWSVQIIATIILNIFIGIGLWNARRIEKEGDNPLSVS